MVPDRHSGRTIISRRRRFRRASRADFCCRPQRARRRRPHRTHGDRTMGRFCRAGTLPADRKSLWPSFFHAQRRAVHGRDDVGAAGDYRYGAGWDSILARDLDGRRLLRARHCDPDRRHSGASLSRRRHEPSMHRNHCVARPRRFHVDCPDCRSHGIGTGDRLVRRDPVMALFAGRQPARALSQRLPAFRRAQAGDGGALVGRASLHRHAALVLYPGRVGSAASGNLYRSAARCARTRHSCNCRIFPPTPSRIVRGRCPACRRPRAPADRGSGTGADVIHYCNRLDAL